MSKKKVIFMIPHIGSRSAECIATNLCKSLSDYEKIVMIFLGSYHAIFGGLYSV